MQTEEDIPPVCNSSKKFPVTVEVCLKPQSAVNPGEVKIAVERLLQDRNLQYCDGPIPLPSSDDDLNSAFIHHHVLSMAVANTDENNAVADAHMLMFWEMELNVLVYKLDEEEPAEDIEGEDEIAMYKEWTLPARDLQGMWESLMYESEVKQRLLRYSTSALLFSDSEVDPNLISWNRVVLLHGPPGTGKTSLCKALAHKLAIKFGARYPQSQLIEVNAHSLFSKWFSESGKLVTKLFAKIQELVDDEESLVFVLIDEVESLTAARQAAVSGAEPSDAIRVVNALLTQIDGLKSRPNVMVLTTTNITQAIDLAFVDRADLKVYIGPPSMPARYGILRTCLDELRRAKIIIEEDESFCLPRLQEIPPGLLQAGGLSLEALRETRPRQLYCGALLRVVAETCEGFSGRILRKLPFLAHTHLSHPRCRCDEYITALQEACNLERADRNTLSG